MMLISLDKNIPTKNTSTIIIKYVYLTLLREFLRQQLKSKIVPLNPFKMSLTLRYSKQIDHNYSNYPFKNPFSSKVGQLSWSAI